MVLILLQFWKMLCLMSTLEKWITVINLLQVKAIVTYFRFSYSLQLTE